MNLQQLRAKYATKTAAVEATPAAKNPYGVFQGFGEKTKDAAVKTGSFIADSVPASRGSVKSIAAELNAKYNKHEDQLFDHRVMLEMIADHVGMNLPEQVDLDAYREDYRKQLAAAEKAKAEAEAKAAPESEENNSLIAALTQTVSALTQTIANLGKGTAQADATEETPAVEKDEKTLLREKRNAIRKAEEEAREEMKREEEEYEAKKEETSEPNKPKQRRFTCSTDGCKKKVYEKGDVCDSCATEEEEKETVPAETKKGNGRRRIKRGKSMIAEDNE